MNVKQRLLIVLIGLMYCAPFYFAFNNWQVFAWFVVGVMVGLGLLVADEAVLYRYYATQTPEVLQLISRSPLFLVAYPVLAFFAITSSGNAFGIGVVLGIGLTLVAEAWLLRPDTAVVRTRFAQHLSPSVNESDLRRVTWVATVIFVGLSLLVFL